MCVAIAMEPGTELSLEEVFKMGRTNADGIGVAWADGTQVEWYKSINYTPQTATKFINDRKEFFRLVHFRLSTVGGVKTELCHPFEVGPLASPLQHGHGPKVLIHNGHWHRWTDIIDILRKEESLPDNGPWSDSRLAAYLASYDEDWLDVITGKIALMDAQGNTKFLGMWENLRPGIKVSNTHWDHNYNYRRSGKDRDWPGWGWTAEEWEAQAKHHEELAKKAEEAAKQAREQDEQEKGPSDATETGKNGKNGEQKAAQVRVGGGPGHGGAVVRSGGGGGTNEGHPPLGGKEASNSYGQGGSTRNDSITWKGDKQIFTTSGDYEVNGKKKVDVRQDEVIFDHTPWQNPSTKRWFWIPPESVTGNKYRVEELDADAARQMLESIAPAVSRPRTR